MTPYYEKAVDQQRYRSGNSSRASRNLPSDDLKYSSQRSSSRLTNNNRSEYYPIPNGSRRIPSTYVSDTPTLRRPLDVYHISPVPQYDRTLSTTPVTRPGSPGPVAGAGEITNTEHGFTIELDVFRFRPEEIKVVLTDDLLSISGERFENAGDGQTLRRSFSRKYSIPEDIHLDSIRSHLTDSGLLVVNGSRRGWRETSISTYQPRYTSSLYQHHKNVISTV